MIDKEKKVIADFLYDSIKESSEVLKDTNDSMRIVNKCSNHYEKLKQYISTYVYLNTILIIFFKIINLITIETFSLLYNELFIFFTLFAFFVMFFKFFLSIKRNLFNK